MFALKYILILTFYSYVFIHVIFYFQVDCIEAAIKDIRNQKIRTLSEKTQIGAHGKPVIFLHPKDCGGVLIELEQS